MRPKNITQVNNEFELVDWIRQLARPDRRVLLGIGDDCAVLKSPGKSEVLVTTDMLMDGRHFDLTFDSPRQVGMKALGVNLSDIAAMAGKPISAFVAAALPKKYDFEFAGEILKGIAEAAYLNGVHLSGGDTNAWDGPLVLCITVVGESTPPGPVKRSGAKLADWIFVTGPLGGSRLGRHLKPQPRLKEARAIHSAAEIHAMIDISDGLVSDLGHILDSSRMRVLY